MHHDTPNLIVQRSFRLLHASNFTKKKIVNTYKTYIFIHCWWCRNESKRKFKPGCVAVNKYICRYVGLGFSTSPTCIHILRETTAS